MSIYVKTLEGWEPLVEGSLEGAPGFPIILNPVGGSVIFFEAGMEGSAGPTIAYGAYITPSGDGATVEVDQETLEIAVSGTEPFTSYRVYVYGVNAAGKGDPSSTNPFQLNYNEATGGTVTVVDDYNGTGEQWKIHTFDSLGTSTFTVDEAPQNFRVLVVGGGTGATYSTGVPYPGGEVIANSSQALSVGDIDSTVGAGGAGGQGSSNPGSPSYLGSIEAQAGVSGASVDDNISGTTVAYGGNGNTLGTWGRGGLGAPNTGGAGERGIVIVSYKVGTSSTTQIKNAQAKQAARSQGQDVGYAEGFSEGYVDFEPLPIPDEDTE